ncbi:MAG: type II toxin-antitoxin system RelE/ParE family toxin [Methanosarcinales archaeon]
MASKRVEKQFNRLPDNVFSRIESALMNLKRNPRPQGVKKLKGKKDAVWRIRVGSYRIKYDIDDDNKQIIILEIGHIRNIYR